jgi:replicative DNA helicase
MRNDLHTSEFVGQEDRMTPSFATGCDLFGSWLADLERGEPPVRYPLPSPFATLDIRPGRLALFGGAPGVGKTAALLQIGVDLLWDNPAARLLVANVEMTRVRLVNRIVSRLAAVPLTAIADRTLTPGQWDRVRAAVAAVEPVTARLAFLHAPFTMEHVAEAGAAFGANVLMLDYIQRFAVGDGKGDKRERPETAAAVPRRLCAAGAAVLVASSLAGQGGQGKTAYERPSLASFRVSSELGHETDSAYLLVPAGGEGVDFLCVKNRHGPLADIRTLFDPTIQKFTPAPLPLHGSPDRSDRRAA